MPTDTYRPQGMIDAHNILTAIDPLRCIFCENQKSAPGVNTICAACDIQLRAVPSLQFLHTIALELYDFWIALLKKTLTRRFHVKNRPPNYSTVFWFDLGLPGVKTSLPALDNDTLEWIDHDKTGVRKSMVLDEHARELLNQVILTDMQCAEAMQLLAHLLHVRLMKPVSHWHGYFSVFTGADTRIASSPITKIEEVGFKPNHPVCTYHWTFRVTLQDGHRFAVNFADRQLGWLRIVVEWEGYLRDCVALRAWQDDNLAVKEFDAESEGIAEEMEIHELGYWLERTSMYYNVHLHRIEAPRFDMVLEDPLEEWKPDMMLGLEERERADQASKCRLEEHVEEYFHKWRQGVLG
ncbi:hypothetical protein EK21DRAFT_112582 [Setomelanomma holmii]|uniref:Uncharacterized protein n=1 Tax=Setomelanomma holmii TaxID=210430 RepID=A0A9P4H7L2_9PLEO|nr:hypothetical protein EK21DRAFT_112582 [Setomelanomma holmii]